MGDYSKTKSVNAGLKFHSPFDDLVETTGRSKPFTPGSTALFSHEVLVLEVAKDPLTTHRLGETYFADLDLYSAV